MQPIAMLVLTAYYYYSKKYLIMVGWTYEVILAGNDSLQLEINSRILTLVEKAEEYKEVL